MKVPNPIAGIFAPDLRTKLIIFSRWFSKNGIEKNTGQYLPPPKASQLFQNIVVIHYYAMIANGEEEITTDVLLPYFLQVALTFLYLHNIQLQLFIFR